jgi:phage portal protein BeeE
MTLFGLNISLSRRSAPAQPPVSQLSPESLAWLRGEDVSYPSSRPHLSNAYEQVVWVYRCVNAIAEQIANIPFLFSRGQRGRESLITSGPLLDFYSQPHPSTNAFQYWELRLLWLLLRGECIRLPLFRDDFGQTCLATGACFDPLLRGLNSATKNQRSKNRRLYQVLLLDPASFHHVIENHRLIGWRYSANPDAPLDSQVFLPEEVWFDRLPNPFDFWRGLSPLTVAGFATKTDFAAASFMHGLMENNADAGLIVRADHQLSDEQQEQIAATLRNRRCRAGAPNRSLFLWGVNEIVSPRLSSADLQFLENRKLSRAEICAAFGVPEEIVTTTDHNKYDVMQGARLNFIENRILPLCRRLEAEENATTIPAILNHPCSPGSPIENQKSKIENPTGWFDLDALPIMQQARRNRLATAKIGFDMGIPFNELNRVLDLGFKPFPWGNTPYLPAKYQPLPAAAPESTADVSSAPSAHAPALPEEDLHLQTNGTISPASSTGTISPAPSADPAPTDAANPGPAPTPPVTPAGQANPTLDVLRALHKIIVP